MWPREGALEYEMKRLHSYGVLVNDVELLRALPLLCEGHKMATKRPPSQILKT